MRSASTLLMIPRVRNIEWNRVIEVSGKVAALDSR